MNSKAMFQPLAGGEIRIDNPAPSDEWKPIMPEENNPLTDEIIGRFSPTLYRYNGYKWSYHDKTDRPIFHVARYDRPANGAPADKQILPLTWCEGPNGKKAWRLKAWPEPRPLYRLNTLAADPERAVIVVEGEKTADAGKVMFPDHIVITSPGGSTAANKVDWTPLEGRIVTIWPDNDEPGRKYAETVVRLVNLAGAASIRIVKLPEGFPPNWDLADQPPAGYDQPKLAQLLAAAQEAKFNIEAPMPLLREIARGEPYPIGALGKLSEAVEAVQGMTLAPIAIPAASALAVASLVVQGFRNVETLGGPRPLSLYMLTVAQSGERKSSCDEPLMAGLRAYEKERADARRGEILAWETNQALWKGDRDRFLADAKKGNGEGRSDAQAALLKLGAEPAAPPMTDRTVTEPTFEGLTRKFAEGMPTLGIFSDEGGQFLGGFAMSSDNRQKTLTALNDLWQGNSIRRTRAGEGSSVLYGRRLAVHLMVQPGVARDFMADPMSADTGFLPRFLICEPPSTIGTRLQANVKRNDVALTAFKVRLDAILQAPLPIDSNTRELTPAILPLSSGARDMLEKYADEVELQQASGGNYATITGYASKSAEQAARIAGVLTAWHDLHASEVSPDTMNNAIQLARFHLSEALRLADTANVSKEIGNAEALRKWLHDRWTHPEVTLRDILQRGPNRLRESPVARAAIGSLEKHGWLVRLPSDTVVRNAPRKEAYRIVRGTP